MEILSTSFNEIYCLNKLIKNDPRLKNISRGDYNSLCFGYLKFAISYFMYDCRVDLLQKVDPTYGSYSFIFSTSDNQYQLSPAPELNSIIYIYYIDSEDNIKEIENYLYSQDTNILTVNDVLEDGTKFIVECYTYGEFENNLDIREKTILAEAMNIPYIEESKNDQNAMKYIVAGKSLRFFSQANHIEASISNYNSQAYNIVDYLISEYSYKGSIDNYAGIAKRGTGG